MATITLETNQRLLLDEMKHLIPQYDNMEVVDILKSAISQIRKCKKVKDSRTIVEDSLSPRIQALIGIVPPFSQEEIESDERLKHILSH